MVTCNFQLNGSVNTLALNGRIPLTMEDARGIIRQVAGPGGWWRFAHRCVEFDGETSLAVSVIAPERVPLGQSGFADQRWCLYC